MKKCYLGIELGSTRIKAVAIDKETLYPISSGSFSWKSKLSDGVWTYDLADAWGGLKSALAEIDCLKNVDTVGISGMMHGYLAFDENWNLLTPFRTWQNTITARAATELTELFEFNVPQRWSVSHLYEAILKGEKHIKHVAHITTLAGYIHYKLTGVNAVGIGEASGIFPIDSKTLDYNQVMMNKLDERFRSHGFKRRARDVFPKVLCAGESGGSLTEDGSLRLDGLISPGTRFAPPEGDAGTGMVATNAISNNTGNISAGTSIFAMVVLEKQLSKFYEEIDMVTTPDGKPVAMVHCNNCTNDINAWVSLFKEILSLFGSNVADNELYTKLYKASLCGAGSCDGILVCNYLSGEIITGFQKGVPLMLRHPNSSFTLANLMRSEIYAAIATLAIGMEIFEHENVKISCLMGHGGLFKTEGVAQKYMAAACKTDISCLETSGEGGPYGMALLAGYTAERKKFTSLDSYLNTRVFRNARCLTVSPTNEEIKEFESYMKEYKKLICVEKTAIEQFS